MKRNTTVYSAASPYESFAPFYDAFTADSDYEAWTEHVLGLAQRLGLRGTTMLDLACGTGKSLVPFLARGFDVTGSDLSPAMLAEAARKAPDVTLVEADLRELGELGSFDLVTCFDDSLNYLLEDAELIRAFRAINSNLADGGLALFDLNTLLAYRTTFARDRVVIRNGTVFAWRGETASDSEPGCHAQARIEVFTPVGDALYERITSLHRQRHFPPEQVTRLLAQAGLECLGVHGMLDDGALLPDGDELRQLKVLYAARSTKGGDVP